MPAATRALVIDARPRGPRGLLAVEHVLGRPVLSHLVEAARECETGPIAIHARVDEHTSLRSMIDDSPSVFFRTGPPPENAAILRADRLYDTHRLRKAIRSGRDPESAVVWRLDRPNGLESAGAELIRRRTYQPLGRFWAFAPARLLAQRLAPTRIRPNAVTMAAATMMLVAATISAQPVAAWGWNIATAMALAVALVLDTSDGHLARLQGTASEFGRWLDAVLDELADMMLHAGIAWGLFARSGRPLWLGLGMVYAIGKYLFVIAQQSPATAATEVEAEEAITPRAELLSTIVRMAGHADLRWHLWIVLAAIGRLEWALIAYAAYFPLRTGALAARKVVRHAA